MKLCISTLACPTWSLGQVAEVVAANGIQGIDMRGLGSEIDITLLPEFNAHLQATLALLQERKLSMPCFNTSVTLVSPAPERWQMMLDECHRYSALAQKTGTSFLRIFGGQVPKGMTRHEARTMAQRHLRQVAKICRSFGCLPLVETHDAWAASAEVLELVHEFDPNEVGVLWDVENPFRRGERPLDTAQHLKRFVRHVHFKDSAYSPTEGKSVPQLLGAGEVPLTEAIAAFHSIGYEGWICLETEKRWHATAPDPEQSIPQFAQFMREHP